MTDTNYDIKQLTDYLLGASAKDLEERFDELSFTDDDFAADLRAAEKDLTDSYVRGQLRGDELERFESHYLATPRRRRVVEFAAALCEFVDENERLESIADQDGSSNSFFGRLGAWALAQRGIVGFGLAGAALVLVFVAIGLWRENRRIGEESAAMANAREELRQRELEIERQLAAGRDDQTEKPDVDPRPDNQQAANEPFKPGNDNLKTPPPNVRQSPANDAKNEPRQAPALATIFLAAPLRGGNVPVLRLARTTPTVAATLEIETDEFRAVSVVLADDTGKTLWTSGATAIRGGRGKTVVRVEFPSRHLQSRLHTLTVSGLGATGERTEIGSYPLRVVLD